ncbi:hypothetical protein FHU10_2607 [Serratia fonticola]|uniref:Uncharacterized protein n=1 Tax=Serratia fonticola TaxID=47917 RepID=A0A542BV24_SERFO|nr:hypothetical protein FHU09_5101 [Serratia fonticola]TQI95565.1 hypothetical protein FHU11_0947 [Serratia fonticola]TVZ70061.1 hypothetical protein FHU10_2607 [Serratia fonticola]
MVLSWVYSLTFKLRRCDLQFETRRVYNPGSLVKRRNRLSCLPHVVYNNGFSRLKSEQFHFFYVIS